jgi:hypothetical protein
MRPGRSDGDTGVPIVVMERTGHADSQIALRVPATDR